VSGPEQRWNEPEAIVLLQRAGKLVEEIETSGARIPDSDRELFHARLVTAHDTQDMAVRIWLLTELPSKSTWKVLARHTGRRRGGGEGKRKDEITQITSTLPFVYRGAL
jgi:hypothetical protein